MRHALLLLVALSVTACSGQYGRPGSPVWFRKAPPEVIYAHYEPVCRGYGYTPGTPDMVNCIAAETRAGRGAASTQALAGTIYAANVQATVSPY